MTAKNVFVEKRDGVKVPYDVIKIKQSIAHAVGNTGANPLALEARIDQFIKNGIKTSAIQANIIEHAKQLATPQEPEWLNVAGKALAADMWANYKLRGKTFLEVVKYNTKKGEWHKDILDTYSEDEINELGNYIDHCRDLEHSHSSLVTAKKKYLGKFELNQHMHMGNAMRFGQFEKPEKRIARVKEFYDVLSNREFSLATPFMINLRKGGNIASCFIIALEDDLESIFDNVKRIARISKQGGGVGVFLGYLRAEGSDVGGAEDAAGPVSQWVKIINDTAVAVNQGGKRAGAVTCALPVWHNDIQGFLDMQTEHGDLRLKSFDVFPQVTMPDFFLERDKANQNYITFCPFEVKKKLGIDIRGMWCEEFEQAYEKIEAAFYAGKLKVAKELKAKDVMKIIMRSQFDSGLPYIAFTDEMNRRNPNKGDKQAYGIVCGNLCTESFSNVLPDVLGHVCNLGSINLGNIRDHEHLAKVTRIATRMLDYGISLTKSPDQINQDHNNLYRTIGIGQMGLHDYLAKNWLNFKSIKEIRDLSEVIEYNAILESVELAKEFGSFDAFENSDWKNGKQIEYFASNSRESQIAWMDVQKEIDKYGMRNSQLTSPAPTTSTSIYQDASASVLPVYSGFFAEGNGNGSLLVAAKYLKENPICYGKTFSKHSPIEIIDYVSEAQKFIDTGCSMELILDQNKEGFTAKDLYDAIHYAHQKKCKTIYYIRSIKKNATLQKAEADCAACAG